MRESNVKSELAVITPSSHSQPHPFAGSNPLPAQTSLRKTRDKIKTIHYLISEKQAAGKLGWPFWDAQQRWIQKQAEGKTSMRTGMQLLTFSCTSHTSLAITMAGPSMLPRCQFENFFLFPVIIFRWERRWKSRLFYCTSTIVVINTRSII